MSHFNFNMMNPDLLWYQSSLPSILHPCCLQTLQWFIFFWDFFHIVSYLVSWFQSWICFFLSPFLFYLFLFVVVVVFADPPPSSSISVQAAKLQWSLDEKVGSSRGTRVSRPFVHLFVCVSVCLFVFVCVHQYVGLLQKMSDISFSWQTTVQLELCSLLARTNSR